MNKILAVITLMLLVGCSPATTDFVGQTQQKLSGPVASYAFEEGSGTHAADSGGNSALQGTFYNGATWTISGKHGKAAQMPSSGASFIQINDITALHLTTGMTLSAWVNPSSNNQVASVITKLNTANTNYNYELISSFGNNIPRVQYQKAGVAKSLDGTTTLPINSWSYIAATYDGTSLNMYENGTLVSTVAQPSPIDTSTGWLEIGSDTGNAFYFRGSIDDVRVYDRALSQSEIQTDMNTAVGQTPADSGDDVSAEASSDSSADVVSEESSTVDAEASTEAEAAPTDAGQSIFPLKLVPGKRYLADQTNKPFFINSEAAWELLIKSSDADIDTYLENRRQKGFNTIMFVLIDREPNSVNPNPSFDGLMPFTTSNDITTPNEAYFARADSIIQKIANKGMQAAIVPAYLGFTNNQWYPTLVANGVANCTTYGTYVGNRYKNTPNIMWVAGGDTNPPDQSYTNAIQTAIRAAGATQLQTVHSAGETSTTDIWGANAWLDIDVIYTYSLTFDHTLAEFTHSGNTRPMYLIESGYEGEFGHGNNANFPVNTPVIVRQEEYETIAAGSMGNTFGNLYVEDMHGAWQTQLDTPGALDISRFAQFFQSRHWELLVADQNGSFITSGTGTDVNRASSARASDGSWGFAYVPNSRNMIIDLSGFSHPVTGKWFDPTNGTYTTIQCSPFNNCGARSIVSTPGNNSAGDTDWVLILE